LTLSVVSTFVWTSQADRNSRPSAFVLPQAWTCPRRISRSRMMDESTWAALFHNGQTRSRQQDAQGPRAGRGMATRAAHRFDEVRETSSRTPNARPVPPEEPVTSRMTACAVTVATSIARKTSEERTFIVGKKS
jgi:hypothetical protein